MGIVVSMDYEDYPSQDDHFNGLEEEIHQDYQNDIRICDDCGDLCHLDNLIQGRCQTCWDADWDEDEDFDWRN